MRVECGNRSETSKLDVLTSKISSSTCSFSSVFFDYYKSDRFECYHCRDDALEHVPMSVPSLYAMFLCNQCTHGWWQRRMLHEIGIHYAKLRHGFIVTVLSSTV